MGSTRSTRLLESSSKVAINSHVVVVVGMEQPCRPLSLELDHHQRDYLWRNWVVQLDSVVLLDQTSPSEADVGVAFLRVSVNPPTLLLELLKSRVHVTYSEESPEVSQRTASGPGRRSRS